MIIIDGILDDRSTIANTRLWICFKKRAGSFKLSQWEILFKDILEGLFRAHLLEKPNFL